MSPAAPTSPRLYFLDWLRIAAFGLLVLYHVGMYYVSWDWHVKSPHAGTALEPWMMLSSPWRLGLLFLVSGAASSLMLARAPDRFLARRSQRLLLPLLAGMAVIVPPQTYFELVHHFGYAQGWGDFLRRYFSGDPSFCRAGGCLKMPTWNHLWFVAYLWVYTAVLAALLRWRPGLLDAGARQLGLQPGLLSLVVLPVAVLAVSRMALLTRFPPTHALVGDLYNHVLYGSLFAAGAVLARCPAAWARMEGWRWPALAFSLATWALLVAYFEYYGDAHPPPEAIRQAQRVLYAAL
jgi:glucan biosynthesis protein C